jgi:hypothetical protein
LNVASGDSGNKMSGLAHKLLGEVSIGLPAKSGLVGAPSPEMEIVMKRFLQNSASVSVLAFILVGQSGARLEAQAPSWKIVKPSMTGVPGEMVMKFDRRKSVDRGPHDRLAG